MSFERQLEIVDELLREAARMESGEQSRAGRRLPGGYERELRLAGLAQRIAQSYTIIEGVLAYVARRIDRTPVTGEDWHKKLISRSAQGFDHPTRPAVISAALANDLLELCEFRHVVRNIYPTRLDGSAVRANLRRLIRATRSFSGEFRVFVSALPPERKSLRWRS